MNMYIYIYVYLFTTFALFFWPRPVSCPSRKEFMAHKDGISGLGGDGPMHFSGMKPILGMKKSRIHDHPKPLNDFKVAMEQWSFPSCRS